MWTACIIGLAGSLHCAGMCSPLAMAITSKKPFLGYKIVYNTGRVLIYGLLGAMAAGFGSLFMLTSYQGITSVVVGSVFLLMGFGAISGVRIPFFTLAINKLTSKLRQFFNYWLQRNGIPALFVSGMLNGLLPCGLTYVAMSYCFILPSAWDGFFYMLLFGVGTWPVMIGVTWLMGIGFRRIQVNYQRITTVLFLFIGIWLIARVFVDHSSMSHNHVSEKGNVEEVICP
ncbi:MAG: sulfite exporter TauE/SafE family protein [Cyclobacteriaceae bacterium]|nr:sulfite exporter TauE/SafE family protein [Cyclobacteriaceae bacterium]